MMNLRMLAVLGIVAVLGMSGCGKKNERKAEGRAKHSRQVKKDHRAKGNKKHARGKKRNERRAERGVERREERNMFAK